VKRDVLLVAAFALTLWTPVPSVRAATGVKPQSPDKVLLRWFANCPHPRKMEVEVSLEGKKLYEQEFDICSVPRSEMVSHPPDTVLKFDLKDESRSFFGEQKGVRLEGNIWQDGGDAHYVVLGLSFAANDHVRCSTTHFVDPSHPSRLRLPEGLVLTTYPKP
jgi:hypothetical protein